MTKNLHNLPLEEMTVRTNLLTEPTPEDARWERLLSILAIARPHGSQSEKDFVEYMLDEHEPYVLCDPAGETLAYVIDVGNTEESETMFSCHIDTVDRTETPHPLHVKEGNIIGTSKDAGCLGADDGAGVWLLLEMIDACIPGCYVFHRGEERGGIGSRAIAQHHPGFLRGFKRAIAFDRRGTHSVITHQMRRCCSDEFAEALAGQLTENIDPEWFFAPDDTGIFTDTANYTDDIGECTNVSCGYEHEHGPGETLDVKFLFALREACLRVDWEALPSKRRPGEVDPDDFMPAYYGYRGTSMSDWDKEFDYYKPSPEKKHMTIFEAATLDYYDLEDWIVDYPDQAAEMLFNLLHREDLK